jgi:hypothetical protein
MATTVGPVGGATVQALKASKDAKPRPKFALVIAHSSARARWIGAQLIHVRLIHVRLIHEKM